MIIGQCPVCSGWTLNPPEGKRCSYCEGKVAPLGPLNRMEVPDGSRISVEEKVYGPDNTLLFERVFKNPPKPDGPVAFLRKYLRGYEEGLLCEGEVDGAILSRAMDPIIDHFLASQEEWFMVSSFCGDSTKIPTEVIRVEIERWGRDIRIKSLDDGRD